MPISQQESLAWVDQELPGARALAERRGFGLAWFPNELECRVTMTQPSTGQPFFLLAEFCGYPELPPVWSFTDESFTQKGAQFMPKPVGLPANRGSIFHAACCVCAPFNRRAHGELDGPHKDWGGLAQWKNAASGYVQAHTLGEMLQVIDRDLYYTKERNG